jgi:serine/threonine protein kinase
MEGADDTGEDDPSDGLASPVAPGDWAELRRQVFDAALMRELCDPNEPLVKIGRFDGLRWIGEGGFGIVFKAIDPKLGRLVALKLCRTRSERVNAAIEAEAQALAQLDHPNIVPVFEPGEHAGGAFFAMLYIDGCNAQQFGQREPPPTWREVVDVYRRVARGLAFAHKKHVVHGDIKPSNILLDHDDFPRLADFGLARIVVRNARESDRDGLRHQAGTLAYMAPEVLCGEPGDERSDQWSLCVSLRHTLAGTAPFSGDTSGELLADIEEFREEILELTEPARLREVLRKGLAMDPLERFSNVDALADALDRLCEPDPSMASPEFESELPHEDEPPSDGPNSTPPESEPTPTSVGEHEPESITPDDPELMPLRVGAAAPTSKPKRGLFAGFVLVGTICVTLGWVGRGRVEVEVLRESEPIPRQAQSLCAEEATDPTVTSDVLLITCSRIRAGKLPEAARLWDAEVLNRRHPPPGAAKSTDEDLALLRAETLIVARTFDDQAERFRRWAWVTRSVRWTANVMRWPTPDDPAVVAADSADACLALLEGLGPEDPEVQLEGSGPEGPGPQSIRERFK